MAVWEEGEKQKKGGGNSGEQERVIGGRVVRGCVGEQTAGK